MVLSGSMFQSGFKVTGCSGSQPIEVLRAFCLLVLIICRSVAEREVYLSVVV